MRLTKNCSSSSTSVSPLTWTTICPLIWPAGIVTVPELATKSTDGTADPTCVANVTTTSCVAADWSVNGKLRLVVPEFPSTADTSPSENPMEPAVAQGENSEVFPDGSVAVAVNNSLEAVT
ncbi:MAG TPA: hypothetical protein VJ784_11350 [Pyrinomonadaceae bacterium]|nr:hypothetical protein [Pyrinomonadaceae bacterium]